MIHPSSIETRLFINNEYVNSVQKNTIDIINPATEEKICQIQEASEQDVELAILAAYEASKTWKLTPAKNRAQMIYKLAQLLRQNLEEFASLEALDNGKPYSLAKFDIDQVAESLEYFAGQADKIAGKQYTPENNFITSYRKEAFRVVGLISPWNYPLLMADWKFAPALAAGCCIVLKPSEVTPLTCIKLGSLIKEAGFPKGVFNIVPGYGPVAGEYLCRHKLVSKVSFTGSNMVGRLILKASAESNLKKVHLELGGKSPVIVCNDCDLEPTIACVWEAIMCNMGQVCDAGSRLYIQSEIYPKIVEGLIKISKTVNIGASSEGDHINFGPLVNKRQFDTVMGFIQHGKEVEKLEVIIGGERHGDKGYFVKPTLFGNVPDKSKLAQEEIFGPVLCVMEPWKTIEEVIERANDTKYGLAAYVFTEDYKKQQKLIQSLEAGSIYVNMLAGALAGVPFGGYKESGFGRDNGIEAVEEFLQIKAVYSKIQ